MGLAEQVKRLLAIAILLCFFLPLAQCSEKQPAAAYPSPVEAAPRVLVPAHDVNFQSVDEIPMMAMYLWPMAFIAVRARAKSSRSVAVVGVIEAVIGGTVLWCVVQTISLWGVVRYGGVILVSAHVLYLLAVAATLYGVARPAFNSALRGRPP